MKTLIRNCRLGDGCRQDWDALERTAEDGLRFCSACRKHVHRPTDVEDLWSLLELGYCVALVAGDNRQADWVGGEEMVYSTWPRP